MENLKFTQKILLSKFRMFGKLMSVYFGVQKKFHLHGKILYSLSINCFMTLDN
jgi:hypothetical protein